MQIINIQYCLYGTSNVLNKRERIWDQISYVLPGQQSQTQADPGGVVLQPVVLPDTVQDVGPREANAGPYE